MLVDCVGLDEETDIGFLWMHSLAAWLYESRCAGFLTGVSPARFLLTEIYNRCSVNKSRWCCSERCCLLWSVTSNVEQLS